MLCIRDIMLFPLEVFSHYIYIIYIGWYQFNLSTRARALSLSAFFSTHISSSLARPNLIYRIPTNTLEEFCGNYFFLEKKSID